MGVISSIGKDVDTYWNNLINGVCGIDFVEEFKDMLERRTGLPVTLWDERLTTVEASRVLDDVGYGYVKKGEVIDKLAAVIILQSYLNYLSNTK